MQLYQAEQQTSNQTFQISHQKYYLIICKAGDNALRVKQTDPAKLHKSHIIGSQINPQDNCQIFMLNKVDIGGRFYEIVSCISDYVFENDNKLIQLHNGKKNKNQLWHIVQAPKDNNSNDKHQYFNIKSSQYPEQALSLEGTLRVSKYDYHTPTQQFRFEQVTNITIQNSCLIVNNYSGRVLDVPAGSDKSGQRIVIWDLNKRWNQRWYFQQGTNAVMIKNILSGKCLDIAGESRQNGAKVVQWPQTGRTNQLWQLEETGNKLYKIWSLHDPSLFLGIKKQQGANGSYLQVCNNQNPTIFWIIEGGVKPR